MVSPMTIQIRRVTFQEKIQQEKGLQSRTEGTQDFGKVRGERGNRSWKPGELRFCQQDIKTVVGFKQLASPMKTILNLVCCIMGFVHRPVKGLKYLIQFLKICGRSSRALQFPSKQQGTPNLLFSISRWAYFVKWPEQIILSYNVSKTFPLTV